jgi:hypothetical protein
VDTQQTAIKALTSAAKETQKIRDGDVSIDPVVVLLRNVEWKWEGKLQH